jgi:hypothetical protein
MCHPTGNLCFVRLAPETRNAVYGIVFQYPLPFFIVALAGTAQQFRICERSDKSQYDTIQVLQALKLMSRQLRKEARTFFYAFKHFRIFPSSFVGLR